MAKPSKPTKTLVVNPNEGSCVPFLRGVLTSSLQDAGLDFKPAYKLASHIRRDLDERTEISNIELRALVADHLQERFGMEYRRRYMGPKGAGAPIFVRNFDGTSTPFSAESLARSLEPCGLTVEAASSIAGRIQKRLLMDGANEVDSSTLSRITYEFLIGECGPEVARRFLIWVEYRRSGRPLILLIGGTNGTGKSTLAAELGHRLDIVRIQSTDMLREVMRKMVSQKLMPVLHTSSFNAGEYLPQADSEDMDANTLMIEGFLAQAGHVNVACDGVLKRAMNERVSLILEGIHVHPALQISTRKNDDAIIVPIMLAALRPEQLRKQLRGRGATTPSRRAERYLTNFDSIWNLQSHLLSEADRHHVQLISNNELEKTIAQVLEVVTKTLGQVFPGNPQSVLSPHHLLESVKDPRKVVMIIIDGLPDSPHAELDMHTPMEAANTPNFDRMAGAGATFNINPYTGTGKAHTHIGTGLLFGIPGEVVSCLGRGVVEAVGVGLASEPDDVLLRCNFATVEEEEDRLKIVDRRAGRIDKRTDELAAALNTITLANGVHSHFVAATQHRGVLRLRGAGLRSAVSDVDPGDSGSGYVEQSVAVTSDSQSCAAALNEYVAEAYKVLSQHEVNAERVAQGLVPANAIICRGAGEGLAVESLFSNHGIPTAVVTAEDTVAGLAHMLNYDVVRDDSFTALPLTNMEGKVSAAIDALANHDFVVLHLKGADIAAHDKQPGIKKAFLEALDEAIAPLLELEDITVTVASDHGTNSTTGAHVALPVPVLVCDNRRLTNVTGDYFEAAISEKRSVPEYLQLLLDRMRPRLIA